MASIRRISGRGLDALRDREAGGFLFVSLLVGVVVGLGAALLIVVVDAVRAGFTLLDRAALGGSRWYVLLSVPAGLSIAAWIARRLAPETAGDGVPDVIETLAVRGGHIRSRTIPVKILATAFTLGGGGSAGREGPIVHLGGAIGSAVARRFRLGEDMVRSLVAAGAAAGIGASFNAPIAGMLFALEVILGSLAVRHMSAVVLASISAAVTLRSLVGGGALLRSGRYTLGDSRELLLYAGLAVVATVVAVAFLRTVDAMDSFARHRLGGRPWVPPLVLGLAVGLVGVAEPRLLGTGQELVTALLSPAGPDLGVALLAALVVGKVVTTSLTLSSGGSGGAFMPSLFLGATLGTAYAAAVAPVWGVSELDPGAFALVGMATVFAAVARAPLTAILIVFEVTGARDYGLILPLMLSATFATFVADRLHPESVYTLPLRRRGVERVRGGDVDVLETVRVGDVMSPPVAARAEESVAAAVRLMDSRRYHGVPVVGTDGLVGIVTMSDVARFDGDREATPVARLMTARPVAVGPETPVSRALERMAVLGVGRLPVVAEDDATRLVGLFRREDAVSAYHRALGESTGRALTRERFRQRIEPDARYYDFRIPPGSVADGKPVSGVSWPEGSTLVSIRRGTAVIVPTGATILRRDDVVTAFGTEGARRLVIERLNAGADEPTAEVFLTTDEPDSAP